MYKFLRLIDDKIVSGYGDNFTWEIGKWYKVKGKLKLCKKGFHCSKEPLDALSYVPGEVIAEVEVKGKSIIGDDKQCWQEMRIIKAYRWTKKDSVKLAIYSAELVIDIFEKKYPDDDRPRKAIEAAKKVLKNDNEKNRDAAWAARDAARAAARDAARAAAGDAAWAARDAARAAAWAAVGDAAWAARDAAWADILTKINTWIINHIKELNEIA